jgi:hypothetical protein
LQDVRHGEEDRRVELGGELVVARADLAGPADGFGDRNSADRLDPRADERGMLGSGGPDVEAVVEQIELERQRPETERAILERAHVGVAVAHHRRDPHHPDHDLVAA